MAAQANETTYTWGASTERVNDGVWTCTTSTLKDPSGGLWRIAFIMDLRRQRITAMATAYKEYAESVDDGIRDDGKRTNITITVTHINDVALDDNPLTITMMFGHIGFPSGYVDWPSSGEKTFFRNPSLDVKITVAQEVVETRGVMHTQRVVMKYMGNDRYEGDTSLLKNFLGEEWSFNFNLNCEEKRMRVQAFGYNDADADNTQCTVAITHVDAKTLGMHRRTLLLDSSSSLSSGYASGVCDWTYAKPSHVFSLNVQITLTCKK